ncbi:MAG: ribbon-helix-helix domain-containing protein [Fervidobacterium sp.]
MSRRGIYFKPDMLKMLEAYSRETGLNPSQIVNVALEAFFSTP